MNYLGGPLIFRRTRKVHGTDQNRCHATYREFSLPKAQLLLPFSLLNNREFDRNLHIRSAAPRLWSGTPMFCVFHGRRGGCGRSVRHDDIRHLGFPRYNDSNASSRAPGGNKATLTSHFSETQQIYRPWNVVHIVKIEVVRSSSEGALTRAAIASGPTSEAKPPVSTDAPVGSSYQMPPSRALWRG
jgi:hypothetical protein